MSLIVRQIFIGTLFAILLTILSLTVTFFAFPIDNFASLIEVKVFDVPYLIMIITIAIGMGLIIGISYGWFWRRKLTEINGQLTSLINGQQRTAFDSLSIVELNDIQESFVELEDKLKKQTELSQRLATERANEREKSLQEVVAQERNRLARELHDSVSQQLFAASMMMSAINEANPKEEPTFKKQLSLVENMIHQSQLEMRALLLHLRPVALKGKSLQEGMKELLSELTQKVPMEVTWKIESMDLDKGIEDQLFRILQEAVSNTLRHAKAESLNVMLIKRDQFVIMRIVDDGVGFDVEQAKTSSYGLQNMQERALEVGGSLKVVSLENQGTRLEVKIPYIKREVDVDD